MLMYRSVCQPQVEYREMLGSAASAAEFGHMDAAFAYATVGGVRALSETLDSAMTDFAHLHKRWLIGIDWCRTEPTALQLLAELPSSTVRIADGAFVVKGAGCTPRLPWHPKAVILRSDDAIGTAAGSGNLSRNGMCGGHEVGSTVVVANAPRSAAEKAIRTQCLGMSSWFTSVWVPSTALSAIADEYERRFKEAVKSNPPVTDDDKLPEKKRRGLHLDRLQKMRTGTSLWIQAGNLHQNIKAGQPGDQLMMSAMTRVFFGAAATDVPINTHLGYYSIRYGGATYSCPLRYSDNQMDVLTLPHPGTKGPAYYDQQPLRFTKTAKNGDLVFDLQIGTAAEHRRWRRKSRAAGAFYQMQGPNKREWGVMP